MDSWADLTHGIARYAFEQTGFLYQGDHDELAATSMIRQAHEAVVAVTELTASDGDIQHLNPQNPPLPKCQGGAVRKFV